MSIGGFGGAGGNGGAVTVTNSGHIVTRSGFAGFVTPGADTPDATAVATAEDDEIGPPGLVDYSDGAVGILAQSIGGGGGNGGFAFAGGFSGNSGKELSVAIGGYGGAGGAGGAVSVDNSGTVDTVGVSSHGILAQSIGGGGGNGGSSAAATLGFGGGSGTWNVNMSVSVGGQGGAGDVAGAVEVGNSAAITTRSDDSYGILAQSIGGGGGNGGQSFTATIGAGAGSQGHTANGSISVGGAGGEGNTGGAVGVASSGVVTTWGNMSDGIRAQSIGGGGGNGGSARGVSMLLGPGSGRLAPSQNAGENWRLELMIGGNGGTGNDAGTVSVSNSGDVVTHGVMSAGIFAQSVGAGGGSGGDGILSTNTEFDYVQLVTDQFLDDGGGTSDMLAELRDMSIAVGGNGGASGNGAAVSVNNSGNIRTEGLMSVGIMAQSVGGGGGIAQAFAEGTSSGGSAQVGYSSRLGIGGAGGAAGDAGVVSITNSGNIETFGIASSAVFAQSVGGGGGVAGNVEREFSDFTEFDFGLGLGFAREGGCGGNGGAVTVANTGNIVTHELASMGIFAQSVGGGGGAMGDAGIGPGWWGSVGGAGSAGAVTVSQTGDITTLGVASHGIFAQSAGIGGAGNINIEVASGSVQGGHGAAGVMFMDGANNTLTNRGTISTTDGLDGWAVLGTTGTETIHNYGTITGQINLAVEPPTSATAWAAALTRDVALGGFSNEAGATFVSGQVVNLGGGSLTNAGVISPGGLGNAITTTVTGDFAQSSTGRMQMDVDLSGSGASDRLDVTGNVDVAGTVQAALINPGRITSGQSQITLISGGGTYNASDLKLDFAPSAVVGLTLEPGEEGLVLNANVDFTPEGMEGNGAAVGETFNNLQEGGGNSDMEAVIAELIAITDPEELAQAYGGVAPGAYGAASQVALDMTQLGLRTLQRHTYRLRSDLREPKCDALGNLLPNPAPRAQVWIERFKQDGTQDPSAGFAGFDYDVSGGTYGFDYRASSRWYLGLAYSQQAADFLVDVGAMRGGISAKIGSLYTNYLARHYYLEASLAKGSFDFRQSRTVQFGGIGNLMKSFHTGDSMAGSLRVGTYSRRGRFGLEPYLSLLHASVDEAGFEETGAGSLDLNVNSHTTKSTVLELGTHIKYQIHTRGGVFIPDLGLAYAKELANGNNDVTAVFSGAPDEVLTVKGRDRGDRFLLNAGFTFTGSGGTSFEARYFSEFKSGYKTQGGMAALFLEF